MSWGSAGIQPMFRIKSDHSGITKDDGTTAATLAADATYTFGATSGDKVLSQTDLSYDDNGVPSMAINQTDSGEDWDAFELIACPKKVSASSTTKNEVVAENGRKIGGTASAGDAKQFLSIKYGAVNDDGKIPVTLHVGYFKKSSGGRSWKSGDIVAPKMDFVGLPAEAAITIPKTLFDATIVTQPIADVTFPKDFYEHRVYLQPAA